MSGMPAIKPEWRDCFADSKVERRWIARCSLHEAGVDTIGGHITGGIESRLSDRMVTTDECEIKDVAEGCVDVVWNESQCTVQTYRDGVYRNAKHSTD